MEKVIISIRFERHVEKKRMLLSGVRESRILLLNIVTASLCVRILVEENQTWARQT